MEDDYLMDDDEVLDEDGYYNTPIDEEDVDNDSDESMESDDTGSRKRRSKKDYAFGFTEAEFKLMGIYDQLRKSTDNKEIVDLLIDANPMHTSAGTRAVIAMEVLNTQGHNRMRNNLFTAETSLTGEDVDDEYILTDDAGLNAQLVQEYKSHIARFVDYLATRDLSKDSTNSKNRKRRHLPAFIIYLFSSGLYDFILNCPTMPEEYDKQINNAMKKLNETKESIVEELAERYSNAGRPEVAERVRSLGVRWFDKEPAEIKTAGNYKDLKLTQEDVQIYKEYRSKFMNVSKSITQDVISDMIEVVDKESGIYIKLKDKTRALAIEDVKQVYQEWSKENSGDNDLANKIIWKKLV